MQWWRRRARSASRACSAATLEAVINNEWTTRATPAQTEVGGRVRGATNCCARHANCTRVVRHRHVMRRRSTSAAPRTQTDTIPRSSSPIPTHHSPWRLSRPARCCRSACAMLWQLVSVGGAPITPGAGLADGTRGRRWASRVCGTAARRLVAHAACGGPRRAAALAPFATAITRALTPALAAPRPPPLAGRPSCSRWSSSAPSWRRCWARRS